MDHTEDSKPSNDSMDLDDLLPQVGEFGRYQKFIVFVVCLPACFPCGFNAFNQLFLSQTPDHWCKVEELRNYTDAQVLRTAIPHKENTTHFHCSRYAVNWEVIIEDSGGNIDHVIVNESWPTEPCKDGWIYDRSNVESTVVTDFDLVCEYRLYPTYALAALNCGGIFGVYVFGMLMDKIGRKKTYFISLTTVLIGGLITALARSYGVFVVGRIVTGLNIPALYQVPFVIALEIVGPKYRSLVTVLITFFYSLGMILLTGVAYLIRDWRTLAFVTSTPFVLYYLYWFILPESPRWLLVRGKFEEASKILEHLAEVNKKELPTSFKQELKQKMVHVMTTSEQALAKRTYGISSLCRTPNMRVKTILITMCWFVNQTVYVGMSYYGPALGDNQYLSFMLSFVVELPTVSVCWLIIDKFGRRWPLCLSMIFGGICCVGTGFVPPGASWATLTLYLIAKSSISASFLIIYPFSGELYPTQLRGLGMGTSAYVAGIGLVIIPFVTYLGADQSVLPLLIMGTALMIGGVFSLRLPETLHHRLPQTLEEGEEFGKDFGIKDCCRCMPLKPVLSAAASYDDLELEDVKPEADEETPLDMPKKRRISVYKLVKQASVLDAPKDMDGTMKMTYYF